MDVRMNKIDLSDDEKRNIFRNNTIRFYELEEAIA